MVTEKKEDLLNLLSRMAKVVGHELRNPLAVIRNSAHFVKAKLSSTGAELDPKIAKHLGFIESEIERANTMIDDIVLLGRAQRLELAKSELHSLLEDVIDGFTAIPNIEIVREFRAGKTQIAADTERFKIAVHKLLGNAAEAMPGGGKIVVSTASLPPKQVELRIADGGTGFTQESLDHLFELYFSTKPRGMGLGLALARMIIEGHGGHLRVESAAGKGAAAVITLPLRD